MCFKGSGGYINSFLVLLFLDALEYAGNIFLSFPIIMLLRV